MNDSYNQIGYISFNTQYILHCHSTVETVRSGHHTIVFQCKNKAYKAQRIYTSEIWSMGYSCISTLVYTLLLQIIRLLSTCVKKRKKKKFYYLLSSSYGARIRGCSNPVHEIKCFQFKDWAHCVYVCDVLACSETWGWAGSLLSLQTDWWGLLTWWRGRLQADSLCHTLTLSKTFP